MKALIYSAVGQAKVVEADKPVITDGEVLVKVRSAGLCGTDIAIVSGKHPRAKVGLVLGHEFAGEVVEINGDASGAFATGDKVTAFPLLVCGDCWACRNGCEHVCRTLRMIGIDKAGGFAEFVKLPIGLTCKLPGALSFEAGALVEPLAVGVHAVDMADMETSDTAVVMGAGPIGLIVGLCLREKGVKNIVMTDINPERLKLAERFSLSVFDCNKCDVVEEIGKLTNGDGADIVFECAGAKASAMQMSELVRSRGKIIMVSVHKTPSEVDLRAINFKEISIIGSRVYTRSDYAETIRMIGDLPICDLISHRLSLDESTRGIELMTGGSDACKIMVNVD